MSGLYKRRQLSEIILKSTSVDKEVNVNSGFMLRATTTVSSYNRLTTRRLLGTYSCAPHTWFLYESRKEKENFRVRKDLVLHNDGNLSDFRIQ